MVAATASQSVPPTDAVSPYGPHPRTRRRGGPARDARVERSFERLQSAVERAVAVRTRPPHRRPSHTSPKGWILLGSTDLELWQIHVRYHRRRSARDRALLVEHYTPYAIRLGRRLQSRPDGHEDVGQVAVEGLLHALDRFDPHLRRPFPAFAKPTIEGTVKRYFRDLGYSVRVARSAHDGASGLRDAQAMLQQDLGREPTEGELADLLGCDRPKLASMLTALASRAVSSLDGAGIEVCDDDAELMRAELRTALRQCIQQLDPQDRELIGLYFISGLRQTEIAERIGRSQMHVSRQLQRILTTLRGLLDR